MPRYKLDVVRVLLLLLLLPLIVAAGVGGVLYANFRVTRAGADIQRAHETAQAVLKVKETIEEEREVASILEVVGPAGELAGKAAFSLYRSNASIFDDAADDARHCDAEVTRERGWVDLFFFEQPTECRAMFTTLGEAPELKDAGVTFPQAVAKAVVDTEEPPPAPSGRGVCTKWEIYRISFTAPRFKKGFRNPRWDAGVNTDPDPFLVLKVETQAPSRSGVHKNRFGVVWEIEAPVEVTAGQKVEVSGFDKDAASDDRIAVRSTVWDRTGEQVQIDLEEFKLEARCAS